MYAREFDGQTHHFGVVGVDAGTLIMYDKETNSRWNQLFGEAVSGPMQGHALSKFDSVLTTWDAWRSEHPDTTVYVKPSVPYNARFNQDWFATIASMEDGPVRPNDLIVGIEGHIDARAYLWRVLAQERVVQEQFEGTPIVVFISQDLTTARAFTRSVGFLDLDFTLGEGDSLVDRQTGTVWNPITGAAESGLFAWFGVELQPLVSTYSVWFAWQKYRPDTRLYPSAPAGH